MSIPKVNCPHCGTPYVEYGKRHMIHILMHRDDMLEDDARESVMLTCREIRESINDGDADSASDILMSNLGLEPDFLESLLF